MHVFHPFLAVAHGAARAGRECEPPRHVFAGEALHPPSPLGALIGLSEVPQGLDPAGPQL
jgi:hypothetical protein